MSKKAAKPQDAKSAAKALSTSKTVANKERRLEKHLKAHPNDAQSAARWGKVPAARKKPFAKGSFPAPNRNKMYRASNGDMLEAPAFMPPVAAKAA